jgi:hypothetical protein
MKRENKKLISYFLMAVITVFCYLEPALAQSKKQVSFETKAKTYVIENNQDLVVFINNIGKYDTVSLEGQSINSKAIEVKGWEVVYNSRAASSQDVGASGIESINPLPEQSIEFKAGTLLVTNSYAGNKRAAIHIIIPTAIRAKVYVNGELFSSGTLSSSSMVQGGSRVSSDKGYSPRATMLQTISRSRENTNNDNVLRKIDAQTLLKLATRVVSVAKIEDKGQSWALVQVTVNQEGIVSSVFYVGGEQRLAEIASDSLKQFSFQPFLVDDKPILVTSLVSVSSRDGEIKLFSEMPK